jgi:ribose 5-phosphate isomerase B
MKIIMGADHRGFKLKEELKPWLIQQGHEVIDVGASSLVPDDDYVDYARAVAQAVSSSDQEQSAIRHQHDVFGVVICGSGVGMDIVANRFKRIRCGLGISPEQVRAARHDDDSNVLALAADYTNMETAKEIIKTFLETEFSGEERYRRRMRRIEEIPS